MARIRVAVITPGTFDVLHGRSGSVERVIREVSERLAGDIEFVVFGKASRGLPRREVRAGVNYIRVPYRSAAGYIRRIGAWLGHWDADVIQVENRPRFIRPLKRRFPGKPVWLGLHSVTFVEPPYMTRREARRCLGRADRIVVNSEYMQGEIERIRQGGLPPVEVNHPGVDVNRFASRWEPEQHEQREQMLQQLGYAGRRIVLYAGRLLPIKGVHRVLQAVPGVVALHPDALFLIVGSARYGSDRITPYVARLHRLAARYPAHVRFVPFVRHEAMPAWYRLADIAAVPSFEREAFGLVAAEAMATGVPVLATRAGGLQEVVEHGSTGLLLDPAGLNRELADGIVRLLDDPDLIRRAGEAAACRARERFAWERTAERWLGLYRAAARGR